MFRTKLKPGVYSIRRANGRFYDIQKIGKTTASDRRTKAKHKPKKRRQGYTGDYKKYLPF